MSSELVKATTEVPQASNGGVFSSITNFEDAQRIAKPLSQSSLVPDTFRGKIEDCIIALEMAQRIGASPLSVMQNIYIVHGKPAWSSTFLIACINGCGRFSPLRYTMTGKAGTDERGCIAWAVDKYGEKLESPEVTIAMAKAEGWFGKNGSKWKTMPELMLRYRAATFFARTYAPELTMGIHTQEEVVDIDAVPVNAAPVSMFKAALAEQEAENKAADTKEVIEVIDGSEQLI